jgi:hypothetical protein
VPGKKLKETSDASLGMAVGKIPPGESRFTFFRSSEYLEISVMVPLSLPKTRLERVRKTMSNLNM